MFIKELTIEEFTNFANNHDLNNYAQSVNYALLMSEYGYDYDLIGYIQNEEIIAASLILFKDVNKINYGYAPKGFLIDYANEGLLINFINDLKNFYYDKKIAFIKFNPEIVTNTIDSRSFSKTPTNKNYLPALICSGCNKLKDNLNFESMFPRFDAIINLKTFDEAKLSKNTRNKINKNSRKGLSFEKVDLSYIHHLDVPKNMKEFFYNDFYNTFNKTNEIDLIVIKLNPEVYLTNAQKIHHEEHENNLRLNESVAKKPLTSNINTKMNSDLALLAYKNDIMDATKLLELDEEVILATALIVKEKSCVRIIATHCDEEYKRFSANYYLHHELINYYKNDYETLNIGGMSGDFSQDSPYYGLNKFKCGFKPIINEYIGELDLVIEPKAYKHLIKQSVLNEEFSTKY